MYHGDEYLQTFCGSPLYASPEIVNGRPYHGPEVDTWSLGVLLYTMVHGTMPFDGQNHKTLVQQISTGNYQKPKNPSGESLNSLFVILKMFLGLYLGRILDFFTQTFAFCSILLSQMHVGLSVGC